MDISLVSSAIALTIIIHQPATKDNWLDLKSEDKYTVTCANTPDAVMYQLYVISYGMELIDNRDVQYYFIDRQQTNFRVINMIQTHFQTLKDAPLLSDHERFPIDYDTITEILSFNSKYKDILYSKMALNQAIRDKYREAISETQELYEIYDLLRDSKCDYYYINARREALKKLRDKIGYDNYYLGILPPYVPIWRFQEI